MVRKIDWENQLGRRLKLRDLHVFFSVVRHGSMAKAAAHLGCSQPAVSEVIAELEHALGVPLLDRSPRGVEPTKYGEALLKGGTAAFDDLRQSIREIEFLADPKAGQVTIGCPESTADALLPRVIQRFLEEHPRAVVHIHRLATPTLELSELRDRKIDVALARIGRSLGHQDDDLNVETLLDDTLLVAAGVENPLTRRSRIDLSDLVNETWVLTHPNSCNYMAVAEAFQLRGLEMPKLCLTTYSIQLRARLLALAPYISTFPRSIFWLEGERLGLKELPVDLLTRPWPVGIVTLKNRTLSPMAQLFIEHIRAFTKDLAARLLNDASPERYVASR